MTLEDLVGKEVLVIMKDNFKKYGILINVSFPFIELQFRDGKTELINVGSVHVIKENERDSHG